MHSQLSPHLLFDHNICRESRAEWSINKIDMKTLLQEPLSGMYFFMFDGLGMSFSVTSQISGMFICLSPHGVYFLLTAPHTPSPDICDQALSYHSSLVTARPGDRGPTLRPTQQLSHKAAVLSTAWCRLDQSTTFINLRERVTKEYIT